MQKHFQVVLASAFLATGLLAQNSGPVQDQSPAGPLSPAIAQQVNQLTVLLSLDPVQKAGVTIYVTAELNAMTGMNAKMAAASANLTAAVESNDTVAMNNAANQIGALTSQENMVRATTESEIFAILTSEQQSRYKLLLSGTVTIPTNPCKPGTPGCVSPM